MGHDAVEEEAAMMQDVHARYLAVTHGLALGRWVWAKAGVRSVFFSMVVLIVKVQMNSTFVL